MGNDFEINEHDLDGEWLRQAQLYNDWASKSANAAKAQAKLRLERKILKATLYKEVKLRLSVSVKEGKEPTGAAIEAEIRTDPRYEAISNKLIDAEEQTGLMDAGKWAMVEKSKALDRLCTDRDNGFFMASGYKSKREPGLDERREQLKEIDKGLREEMQSKRKINRG
jgi:hypothetical protein